jgi:adenosylcobinamide-phosphate synthase
LRLMGSIDPLILFAAALLDVIVGDPQYPFHPVRLIGHLASLSEAWFRRIPIGGRWQGIFFTGFVLMTVIGITLLLLKVAGAAPLLKIVLEIYLSYTVLAGGALWREVGKVAGLTGEGETKEAQSSLSFLVSRDTEFMGPEEILRADMETLAENTSDGIVGPLFYLVIGGVPLAVLHKVADTLDSMVGYKKEPYMNFGWASAKLDDVLNFIPSRLTALLLALAARFMGEDATGALRAVKRYARLHESPNAGYPEAAMAGALRVRLGGPCHYFGKLLERPYIGEEVRPLTLKEVGSGILLSKLTFLIALLLALVLLGLLNP